MAAYYSYYPSFAVVFVGLAAALIFSALIRRDWRGLPYAVIFTGPAAVAWIAYAIYESNLDLGVAPIRIDLPFLWAGLLTVSAPAALYALVRVVEVVIGMELFAVRSTGKIPMSEEPLRSWQNPEHPRE